MRRSHWARRWAASAGVRGARATRSGGHGVSKRAGLHKLARSVPQIPLRQKGLVSRAHGEAPHRGPDPRRGQPRAQISDQRRHPGQKTRHRSRPGRMSSPPPGLTRLGRADTDGRPRRPVPSGPCDKAVWEPTTAPTRGSRLPQPVPPRASGAPRRASASRAAVPARPTSREAQSRMILEPGRRGFSLVVAVGIVGMSGGGDTRTKGAATTIRPPLVPGRIRGNAARARGRQKVRGTSASARPRRHSSKVRPADALRDIERSPTQRGAQLGNQERSPGQRRRGRAGFLFMRGIEEARRARNYSMYVSFETGQGKVFFFPFFFFRGGAGAQSGSPRADLSLSVSNDNSRADGARGSIAPGTDQHNVSVETDSGGRSSWRRGRAGGFAGCLLSGGFQTDRREWTVARGSVRPSMYQHPVSFETDKWQVRGGST